MERISFFIFRITHFLFLESNKMCYFIEYLMFYITSFRVGLFDWQNFTLWVGHYVFFLFFLRIFFLGKMLQEKDGKKRENDCQL